MTAPDLATRLEALYVPAVLDALEEAGLRSQVMAPGHVPTDPRRRVAGPAFTYTFVPSANQDRAAVLPPILAAYEAAPPGSVLVAAVDEGGTFAAHFGELSAATCLNRGLRGAVVDGGLRDGPFVASTGFPVWYRYRTPADVVGRYEVARVGEPVVLGGVRVRTGDYLACDLDGIVVIPVERVEAIVAEAERCVREEAALRDRLALKEGAAALFDEFGRF